MLKYSNNNNKEMMDLCDYYPKYSIYDFNDNKDFEEDYFEGSSEFIPRVEGTELELGVTFLNLNYLPILTSRVVENKRKYYLFDTLKIWTSNNV